MVRYWITMAHAVALLAHGALVARDGAVLAAPADPAMLTVGELAARIWTQAGGDGDAELNLVGIRRGETMSEVLTRPGEELSGEPHQGISVIEGEIPTAGAAWVVERLPERASRESARAVWLEAMSRPGLLAPTGTHR